MVMDGTVHGVTNMAYVVAGFGTCFVGGGKMGRQRSKNIGPSCLGIKLLPGLPCMVVVAIPQQVCW